MELRSLGKCGLRTSVLSLGAMTFGDSDGFMKGVTSPDDEARRVFDRAIDLGMNLVDTANVYGDGASEVLTGRWIKGKRDKVLLATKCRFGFGKVSGPHESGLSRQHILKACDDSLDRLGTDVIDLYQVHMQDGRVPIDETLRALDDLVRAGKVRYIGCSNYAAYRIVESLWSAEKNRTERYVSVQLHWSLVARDVEREVIPACRTFGLGTLVFSPLARGFLSGKYVRGEKPPAGTRLETWQDSFRTLDNDRGWAIVDALRALAKQRETTPSAIALAWLLGKPETSTIIVGARTVAQLDDNARALDVKLTAAELQTLDTVSNISLGYPYDFITARNAW